MGGTGWNNGQTSNAPVGSGYQWNVNSIGITEAASIVWNAEGIQMYNKPSTDYAAIRNYMIDAAQDLYGTGSCEEIAVTNAWYAVGVGAAYSGNAGLSISGDNTVCTTSNNYTITNLPSGTSVTWSVSPAYATANTPNAQQTTLTKHGNGIATLTATITNVCGGSNIVLNKSNIVVGAGSNITCTYNSPDNSAETMLPTPPPPPRKLIVPVINSACIAFGTNVSVPTGSTVTWNITVDPGVVWGQGGNNIWCDFTALNQVVYFTATVINSCGSYDVLFVFQCTTLNTCGIQPQFVYQPETESRSVTLLPNPASNTVTITSANTETTEATTITGSKNSTASKITAPDTKTIIKQVRIFDVSGRLMKQMNYSTPQQQVNIDVAALQTGIYFVIISDGKKLSYKKMFIQR